MGVLSKRDFSAHLVPLEQRRRAVQEGPRGGAGRGPREDHEWEALRAVGGDAACKNAQGPILLVIPPPAAVPGPWDGPGSKVNMLAVLASLPVSWNIGPQGKPTQWFWGPVVEELGTHGARGVHRAAN